MTNSYIDEFEKRYDQKIRILLKMAEDIATMSRDPSTQVGALIIDGDLRPVSWGYNGFPMHMEDTQESYLNRELKLEKVIHAELNAILNIKQKTGQELLSMVCTHLPCHRCMTAIIQTRIFNIYYKERPEWETRSPEAIKSSELSKQFAKEAGINLIPLRDFA